MSDFDLKRGEMIQAQIQERGITDEKVLDALMTVPRHEFIPCSHREKAYDDHPVDIGNGQTISQPFMVALMTDLLALNPNDRVLEIGTGSGYQTAILAHLAQKVFTIERDLDLACSSKEILTQLGFSSIHFAEGDGTLGLPEFAPYDAIIVTAGAPKLPGSLLNQLAIDGSLICPVGDHKVQKLLKVTRTSDGFHQETFGNCKFVPLVGREGWNESDS